MEDKAEFESVLLRYVEDGGAVIFEEPNRGGDDWFDVESAVRPVPEFLTVGTGYDSFQTKRFSIGGGEFSGTFYDDAGTTEMSGLDADGEIIPIIQKREIGEGALYWVCCNIGNHTLVNPGNDFDISNAIRSYFEREIGGFGDIWPEPFVDEVEFLGPSDWRFEYESDASELVVISIGPLS